MKNGCGSRGLMDFDDLLTEALGLLYLASEPVRKFCRRFRYLLVDEFRDISPLQYRLILAWNREGTSFCDRGSGPVHIRLPGIRSGMLCPPYGGFSGNGGDPAPGKLQVHGVDHNRRLRHDLERIQVRKGNCFLWQEMACRSAC